MLFLAAVLAVFVALRLAFIGHGRDSRVDAYYWEIAAKAYREHSGKLPVRIENKYLLEDEEQGYPPLFGYLLSRFPESVVRKWGAHIAILVDMLTIVPVLGLLWFYGLSEYDYITLLVILISPFLLIYGKQINSRTIGQFFLVTGYVFQVIAADPVVSPMIAVVLWAGAVLMAALVLLTHKMTMQIMVAIWPFWSLALGSVMAALVPILGLFVAILVVGWDFMAYQFRAHWDIVRFWNRNWPLLGAHMFNNSPVYGNEDHQYRYLIHHRGMKGVMTHLKKVVSYAPLNLMFMPEVFLTADLPWWLIAWYVGANVFIFATLFVPPLKCFGAGHYYVLNATVPAGLGWAYAFARTGWADIVLFSLGGVLTIYSIVKAWQVIGAMPSSHDRNFDSLISRLQKEAPARVAAFPVTAAEAIANQTAHAVLWGGHGYGFTRLEPMFPVLRIGLSELLRKYSISWLVWDRDYWNEFESVLKKEGVTVDAPISCGNWCMVRIFSKSGE